MCVHTEKCQRKFKGLRIFYVCSIKFPAGNKKLYVLRWDYLFILFDPPINIRVSTCIRSFNKYVHTVFLQRVSSHLALRYIQVLKLKRPLSHCFYFFGGMRLNENPFHSASSSIPREKSLP